MSYHFTTWNMQGSNATTENKWNTGVAPLSNVSNVVCLQECGGVPASAKLLEENIFGVTGFNLYSWGTDRANKYILHYKWDIKGNRVNLAIVTKFKPLQVSILLPDRGAQHRPTIGIFDSQYWYYTIHAISPGGADAPGIIQSVISFTKGAGWYIAGDYNREPNTLNCDGYKICPVDGNTYSTLTPNPTTKIDYSTTNNTLYNIKGYVNRTLILSDHYAVSF